jgi:carboxyl-terminal processing protease
MNFKTRLSVLLVSTPVLAFVIVGGLMGHSSAAKGDETFQQLRVFEDVVSLVLGNYVEEVKVDRVMEGAMKGLADGLDPDSAYLTTQQVRDVEANTPLPDGEVGLELTRRYYLIVIAAREGSPAGKAGLQTGDYVRAIDGNPTREMSVFEGVRLLRGAPGSKVTLTVIRGNAADPHEVVLVREKASGTLVSGRMLAPLLPDAGYLRIGAFRNGVADQIRRQVAELAKAGAKSLIVDVRNTAEGSLDNGLTAARLFVKSGTLAIKVGREKTDAREPVTAAAGDGSVDLPVLLLTTTGTSGAAELFTAALGDNDRAEVMGERTLGRSGLQKLVKLPESRGLWLTYARYLTPKGEAIHGKGIEPDVEADTPEVEFGAAPQKDVVLDAAIELLQKKKAA